MYTYPLHALSLSLAYINLLIRTHINMTHSTNSNQCYVYCHRWMKNSHIREDGKRKRKESRDFYLLSNYFKWLVLCAGTYPTRFDCIYLAKIVFFRYCSCCSSFIIILYLLTRSSSSSPIILFSLLFWKKFLVSSMCIWIHFVLVYFAKTNSLKISYMREYFFAVPRNREKRQPHVSVCTLCDMCLSVKRLLSHLTFIRSRTSECWCVLVVETHLSRQYYLQYISV